MQCQNLFYYLFMCLKLLDEMTNRVDPVMHRLILIYIVCLRMSVPTLKVITIPVTSYHICSNPFDNLVVCQKVLDER